MFLEKNIGLKALSAAAAAQQRREKEAILKQKIPQYNPDHFRLFLLQNFSTRKNSDMAVLCKNIIITLYPKHAEVEGRTG